MQENTASRVELIIAGLGGMGVLAAGRLLANAALQHYRHISWVPSYGYQRRAGSSECTTILSQQRIASPIMDWAATVILLDGSQLKPYESRVSPGGLMLVESAGLKEKPDRKDFRLMSVSGLEIAMSMGGVVVNNLIMLGVYIELVKPLPAEAIQTELERQYGRNGPLLERNHKAFQTGVELGRTLRVQSEKERCSDIQNR